MKKSSAFALSLTRLLVILICISPLYVMFYLSLSSSTYFFAEEWFPREMLFENFTNAWDKGGFDKAFFNSVIITVGAVVLLVFCAASAGYAAARFRTRMNRTIFNVMLMSMLVPGMINTVPLYILMRRIDAINTYWGMILLLACSSLPFSIFLYESFISSMGRELEEAAVIDGCTPFQAFWRVVFPQLKPITATVIIMQGIGIWNNYGQAVYFLQNKKYQTVPLAIARFFNTYGADYNMMAAAALIGLMPVLVIFVILQKQFISGLAAGAVKG